MEVNLKSDEETGLLKMKQPGLINCVSSTMRLDYEIAKIKYTPAGSVPLVKNGDGVPVSGKFNYSNVIEILLYLSGHKHPIAN